MRIVVAVCSIAFALAASSCTTRTIGPAHDTGAGGGRDTGTGVPPEGGAYPDVNFPDTGFISSGGCSSAAMQWIYLVDSNNAFLRYAPNTNTITTIGTLSCPSSGSPFSMAVSRDAVAYVLYSDHHIYAVSTTDASCTATAFTIDQMNFQQFGMGFVSDAAGGTSETLFIAGGPAIGIGGGHSTLGSLPLSTWTVSTLGPLDGSPELTGNGLAELWGFFPDATPMAVRQIDKSDGHTIQQYDVSAVDPGAHLRASAWAFAFWGGRDYMFYQAALGASSGIYRLNPDTNAVDTVMADTGYRIVGAGVSTCAPTAPM